MHKSNLGAGIVDCRTDDLAVAATFRGVPLGMTPRELPGSESDAYRCLEDPQQRLESDVQKGDHASRVICIEADEVEAEVRCLDGLGAVKVRQVSTWWVMEALTGQRFSEGSGRVAAVRARGRDLAHRRLACCAYVT